MTMTQIALAIVGAVDLVLTGAFVALLRQNRTGFVGYVVLTPRCFRAPDGDTDRDLRLTAAVL